ncbi:MAG TPA: hypothetical protein VI452_18120 [Marmoricola sp.]
MTRPHSPWAPVAALVLLISALVVAFAWPTSRLAPHHLPVAVAGPPRAAHQVQAQLDRALGPDAVDVTPVGDRHAVVAQIRHRAAYAGLVPPAGPGRPPELLVASAASPAVAQGLTAAAETGAGGSAPKITDVAPLPAADPHGAVFALATVPLVIGGILTGALLALAVTDRRRRPVALVAVAVLAGAATTGVLDSWLGALAGAWIAEAAVIALGITAVGAALLGLHRLAGLPGLGLGAATMLLLGVPLSGAMSAPELLPAGWSTLGQLLPPGAAASALRSTAFFDGNGSAGPLLVLGCWAAAGLLLLLLPGRSAHRRPAPEPGRVAVPAGR